MTTISFDYPKTPRWISTEAGEWAWRELLDWRSHAHRALAVQERVLLLQEAESRWTNASNTEFREVER